MRLACDEAKDLLDYWLPRFGFGHYRVHTKVLPASARGKLWARCHWNHDEEFVNFQFVPDGVLKRPQMEALVLHELSHGLCRLAEDSDGEERVCNRIARLALGGRQTQLPNEWMFASDDKWWDTLSSALRIDPTAAPMLRALIDELPEMEREVVNRRFYERQPWREMCRELGLFYGDQEPDIQKAKRILRRGLAKLGVELEDEGLVSGD